MYYLTLVNNSLFFLIYNLHGKLEILDQLMIFGAKDLIFIIFFLSIILAIFKGTREKKALLIAILAIIMGEVLLFLIHLFFIEPRPFVTFNLTPLIGHIPDASFPSEHTTIMSVIAFSYLLYKSKFSWLFLIAMLWVGFSRIYVGIHYPLDILGGIVLGFISVYLIWIFKKLFKEVF